MEALVFSDSHGKTSNMIELLNRRKTLPDMLIHLGDTLRDADVLAAAFPRIPLERVRGNNDYGYPSGDLDRLVLPLGGHNVFLSHGHLYGVKRDHDALVRAARASGCDIVLFGHTHEPLARYESGVYILNPGSIGYPASGKPSFGLLSITPAGVSVSTARV